MDRSQLEEILQELVGVNGLDDALNEMRELEVQGAKAEREHLIAAIGRAQRTNA